MKVVMEIAVSHQYMAFATSIDKQNCLRWRDLLLLERGFSNYHKLCTWIM